VIRGEKIIDVDHPDFRVKKLLLDYAAGKILMFSAWNGIKNEF
jgi:hypothetical protein